MVNLGSQSLEILSEIDEEVDRYSSSKTYRCPSNPHDRKIEDPIHSLGRIAVPSSSMINYRMT